MRATHLLFARGPPPVLHSTYTGLYTYVRGAKSRNTGNTLWYNSAILSVVNLDYTHTYIHMYVHMYTYVHTYVRTHVHTYVRTNVCMYVCTYVKVPQENIIHEY